MESGNTILRSRLASIAHLMSGSMAVAAMMALSTVVAARALGPEAYGILALVLTVGRICERLIRFESWQALIRFGTQTDTEDDPEKLGRLFLLGLMLDFACAWFAAALMLVGGYFLLPFIGLDPSHFVLLAIFAPAIAFNIRGVPTAALRMAGQFRLLAYFGLFSATLRLALAALAWSLGAELAVFLAVWTLAQLIDVVVFAVLAARALNSLGVANPISAGTSGILQQFPEFMRFAWSTNASSALRTLTQEADTLMVGALAGPTSAGFYHIAKRFAKVAQQIGQHVQAVIYPDLSRMWARKNFDTVRTVKTKVQLALISIGLAIVFVTWAAGALGVEWLFGDEFSTVYPLLLTQLIAVTLILVGAPARSTMLAMNRPGTVLIISAIATLAFFATAYILIPDAGAIGANYAHIAFSAVTFIALEITFRSAYGTYERREAPA